MTKIQRLAVSRLYFLFGNGGPKFTRGNHNYLCAKLYEDGPEHSQPTDECRKAFAAAMDGDWSMLAPKYQKELKERIEADEKLREAAGIDDE